MIEKEHLRDHIRKQKEINFVSQEKEFFRLSRMTIEKVIGLNYYQNGQTIALFASKKESHEVQTDELIAHSLASGKEIYLPRCITESRDLEFLRIHDLKEETERGAFSIREPKRSLPIPDQDKLLRNFDLLFVPGMAFSANNGIRLGFGSGYYDKFIERLKENNPKIPIIGLAFDFQVFSKAIPHEKHDSQVDIIITPNQIIYINQHNRNS